MAWIVERTTSAARRMGGVGLTVAPTLSVSGSAALSQFKMVLGQISPQMDACGQAEQVGGDERCAQRHPFGGGVEPLAKLQAQGQDSFGQGAFPFAEAELVERGG
jgi:hypothetical protein